LGRSKPLAIYKKWVRRGFHLALTGAVVLGGIYALVWWTARGVCYSNMELVPPRLAGLVLGCVKKIGPNDNVFFNTRVNAAAKLFHAGKVQYLIVTGDNSRDGYDEPTDLKAALIKKGVPADHIYCDYAGFRTLDSIVRARKIFNQEDVIIISQRFHNERAVYLAKHSGMLNVVAFDAADPNIESKYKMYFREIFARCKAVCDVEILGTQPKFLGELIRIGPNHPPVDAVAVKKE
jgi:SanA protein